MALAMRRRGGHVYSSSWIWRLSSHLFFYHFGLHRRLGGKVARARSLFFGMYYQRKTGLHACGARAEIEMGIARIHVGGIYYLRSTPLRWSVLRLPMRALYSELAAVRGRIRRVRPWGGSVIDSPFV